MREKIISKATGLFLKLGFKNVTMDDIASELCVSKKTIYKYFPGKEILVREITAIIHKAVHENIKAIVAQNFNAIEENFQVRRVFKEMFKAVNSSPIYQLKKMYPNIYSALLLKEVHQCKRLFKQNIEKGIQQGLYRKDVSIEHYASFYYTLIFSLNQENNRFKSDFDKLEIEALEYHTRAMATPKGILELEKHIV